MWGMEIGTWMYYFLLPWGTFVFTVVYAIYWLISDNKKEKKKEHLNNE
jgi:phage shock protein PspC (stress-responsive transcriptional regulator)